MKRRPLTKISLRILPEGEEPVQALLETVFQSPPSLYLDQRTGRTVASVFVENSPAQLQPLLDRFRRSLRDLRHAGLSIGPGRLQVTPMRHEDWAESWKHHFKPLVIEGQLLIRPSWSKRLPARGQAEVVLDPGLSFGTGQHPTTLFCLQQIVQCHDPSSPGSLLDMGTGSGILAISAARLGYGTVHAFDFDEESIRIAQENARTNGVDRRMKIEKRDLTRLPLASRLKYDVVAANLTEDLLRHHQERILARLKPAGRLILAGILRTQFVRVRDNYRAKGMKLLASKAQGEWRSGSFTF